MHLDDESIQRLVHGELATRDEAAATFHLERCAECRLRFSDAKHEEEWIFELLREIDHPVPEADANAVSARMSEGARADVASGSHNHAPTVAAIDGVGGRPTTSRTRTTLVWARLAAGLILLLAAAGVAYAVPGSPVRAWMSRVVGASNGASARPPRVVPVAPANPWIAGVAVAPSGRFTIRFITTQKKGTATVSLTNGSEITVSALDGTAAFTSGIDRLTIDNAASENSYEIHVPRGAHWVEILVADRRLLLKRGDQVVTSAGADSGGHYVLPLTSAASR